jgi:hypothetical protein
MKNTILLTLAGLIFTFTAHAYASEEDEQFSEGELAQMLAPIALYPDTLLTHILIASTYPLEIVQAQRWLDENENPSESALNSAIENKEWDASVKALLPFPKVIARLNTDLIWTQELGDAFLSDEEQVLVAIQQLRLKAQEAGTLAQMENVEVEYEEKNIIIQPVQKEIVYVPYYDTRVVYGNWYWAHYPPVYWVRPRHYYGSHYPPFYWHSGVHISFSYYFGAFHWSNRHVVVVNHYNHHRYPKRRAIISSHGAKRWQHKVSHRRGVAYRSTAVAKKYRSNRASYAKVNTQRHLQKKLHKSHTLNTRAKNRAYEVKGSKHAKITNKLKANQIARHNVLKKMSKATNSAKVKTTYANRDKVKTGKFKNDYKSTRQSRNNAVWSKKQSAAKSSNARHDVTTKRSIEYRSNKQKSVNYARNSQKDKAHNNKARNYSSHAKASSSNKASNQTKQRTYQSKGSSQRYASTSSAQQGKTRNKN